MVESNNQFEHGHVDSSILGLLGCDNSFVKRLEQVADKTPQVYLAMASAYIRLGQFSQASDAVDKAEKDNGALLWVAFLRGKINFYLTNFQGAKECLVEAKALADSHSDELVSSDAMEQISVLLNKVNLELSTNKTFGDINKNVYLDAGKVPAAVKQQTKPSAATSKPVEEVEQAAPEQKQSQAATSKSQDVASQVINPKYDWYQNGTHAFVSYKILDSLASPNLNVRLVDQKNILITFNNNPEPVVKLSLAHEYMVDQSSFNITAKKIELKLAKQIQNVNWNSLDQPDSVKVPAGPSYPTSSKVKKDWSAIDKEIEKEESKEKPEGDAALNGLFKQIYERSDEATRRAMIKSYQTSGGTVLSTNWGEVADKDYEGQDRPSAPDGQQWAK